MSEHWPRIGDTYGHRTVAKNSQVTIVEVHWSEPKVMVCNLADDRWWLPYAELRERPLVARGADAWAGNTVESISGNQVHPRWLREGE